MRTAILSLLLLPLAGCPKPPRPATVDPTTVTAITLGTTTGVATYCPHGTAPQLVAQVTTSDGKLLQSWTPGEGIGGRLEVKQFEFTTTWGGVDESAQLRLPYDPVQAIDRDVTISVRLVDRPDLVSEITLAPTFGCGGYAGDAGEAGASGWGGSSGSYGSDGAPGADGADSTEDRDPTDGGDGGDGGDGSDGGHGSDGGDGGPGPHVDVALTRIDTERHGPLIAVAVMTRGGDGFYLVDPDGEGFTAFAVGGAGGSGGAGGAGGAGGRGGDGGDGGDGLARSDGSKPTGGNGGRGGDGGHGGNGGDGGNGGRGGDGGSMRVVVDPRYPDLARAIGLTTRGGDAGYGGGAGYGGAGGSGGSAGTGGMNGGTSGSAGTSGNGGSDGRRGADGRPGRDGRPPEILAGDVAPYFEALRAAGLWAP